MITGCYGIRYQFGTNGYEATVLLLLSWMQTIQSNVTKVDASKLSYKDGKLTIDREVFSNLDAGNYKIAFVFDDAIRQWIIPVFHYVSKESNKITAVLQVLIHQMIQIKQMVQKV